MTTIASPEVDLFSLVYILGAAQGLFLVLALTTVKKGGADANRFLALFTLIFSITLLDIFLEYTRYYVMLPDLLGVIWPSNFLYGPLLLFYTGSLLGKSESYSGGRLWWHLTPFVVDCLLLLPWFTLPGEIKLMVFFTEAPAESLPDEIQGQLAFAAIAHGMTAIATVLHIGVYLLLVMNNLRQHRRHIREHFSYTENISLDWLRNLTLAGLMLWSVLIFSEWFAQYLGIEQFSYHGMHVLIALFIYTMGFMGLRQPRIFSEQPRLAATEKHTGDKLKYEKSSLDIGVAQELAVMLQEKMQADKLYLDSSLNLTRLAHALETSPHYLSQTINSQFEKNFFDFVNEYRIEEAKVRILASGQGRMNVLAIALDSGFNSKSAFYTAFKRHTGMNPGEYRLLSSSHNPDMS